MLGPIQHIDPESIEDIESFRDIVKLLLNIVEQQSSLLEQVRQENQELKDEINRLRTRTVFNPAQYPLQSRLLLFPQPW